MQHLLKIPFVRNRLYANAAEQFIREQEKKGNSLRSTDIPERLEGLRTLLIDASLLMQEDNSVRRIAAPLEVCDLSRLKHQSAWMVLVAGVSLGCEGYAPLARFTEALNFSRERMLRQYPLVHAIPYDDDRCIDTTVHRDASGLRAYSKGDTEAILSRCSQILDGKERPLEAEDREKALQAARQMEAEGLETLAFATHWTESSDDWEREMTFLGIVGAGDLPNDGAAEQMEALRKENVRPVLVTKGDISGRALCASGVLREDAGIMEADEIDAMTNDALRHAAMHADAFLRLTWQQRERVMRALRVDGAVATLSPHPETARLVLAMGTGKTPDVIMEKGTMQKVIELLADCRTLVAAYQPEQS